MLRTRTDHLAFRRMWPKVFSLIYGQKQQNDILIIFSVPRTLVRLIKTCLDGTQSEVRIGNYLSSRFPIENGLKQGGALSRLLSNFALQYAIRTVQETGLGLDMIGLCG